VTAVGFNLVGGLSFLGHEDVRQFGKKLSAIGENLIVVLLDSLRASSPFLSFSDSWPTSDLLSQFGFRGKFEPSGVGGRLGG
jgi:hypothetical protein